DMQSFANRYAAWTGASEEPPLVDRVSAGLAGALLQPQDYVNKLAAKLTAIADAIEAPYSEIPDALGAARALAIEDTHAVHWAEPVYNATGNLLRRTNDHGVYLDAAARIADLEGVRRAAVLTAELRSQGLAPDEVEAALEVSAPTSPYTGEPLGWDADSGEIVFQGLQRRDDGRYAFWY